MVRPTFPGGGRVATAVENLSLSLEVPWDCDEHP